MSDHSNHNEFFLTSADRREANKFITTFLQDTMNDGKKEFLGLRKKLSYTYWVVVWLSISMFILGVALLCVPLVAALKGNIDLLHSMVAAGFGITDLGILFLFRPLERIHELMGDMSQLTMVLNSFQRQVGLRLKEMNSENRKSIGRTAEKIAVVAHESAREIQEYFEEELHLTPDGHC